jgi:hypothetical protein
VIRRRGAVAARGSVTCDDNDSDNDNDNNDNIIINNIKAIITKHC